MNIRLARLRAEALIEELRIEHPPVSVLDIAGVLGIPIIYADLGPDVSGLLVSDHASAKICIQETDPEVRKRFSIAHELGHFVLRHQFAPGEHIHVDKGNFISHRGPLAAAGIDPKEIEANQFAASLLMPHRLLQREIAQLGKGPVLDQHVLKLATQFEVSEQAMTIRLSSLSFL